MSDLAYIESYFRGETTPEERREFEQKINDNPVFADDVAFYCSTMQVIKDQLAEEKKKQFWKIYEESKTRDSRVKPNLIKRLWPYIGAAAVLAGLIFGLYMYSNPSSPQQLADQYIRKNFEVAMGVEMSGKEDSLNAAMRLFNDNKLTEALRKFEIIIQADSISEKAKKMAGIVSLRIGGYDKAVEYFTQLENLNLYSNPGKLYHAIALIKRNKPGDKEIVKQLLQQLIEQDLEGSETAKKLIKLY